MTRKDYIVIAQAIKDARIYEMTAYSTEERDAIAHGVNMTASSVATALAADNERFDRERFLKACSA